MSSAVSRNRQTALAAIASLVLLAACADAAEPAAGPWSRRAPMPTARSELTSGALDGRIYVGGGIAQLGTTTAFEAYDPAQFEEPQEAEAEANPPA